MDISALYKLLVDSLNETNAVLTSEVQFLRAENRLLREHLESVYKRCLTATPEHLRLEYRKVECKTVVELAAKIDRREERSQPQAPTIPKRPSPTKADQLVKLGLDISSSSEDEVLNLEASPLHEEEHVTKVQIRKIQAYRKPPRIILPERTDRQGKDHGYMKRRAQFIAQPRQPGNRCIKCHQRAGHSIKCPNK